jgi:hypothetical protein
MDLFEDVVENPQNHPPKLVELVDMLGEEYEKNGNSFSYKQLAELLHLFEKEGYTFDYGLDGEPHSLKVAEDVCIQKLKRFLELNFFTLWDVYKGILKDDKRFFYVTCLKSHNCTVDLGTDHRNGFAGAFIVESGLSQTEFYVELTKFLKRNAVVPPKPKKKSLKDWFRKNLK